MPSIDAQNTQSGVLSGKMRWRTAKLGIPGYNATKVAGVDVPMPRPF